MKIVEIVAAAQVANPQAFGKVEQNDATRIARVLLKEIGKRIDATEDGPVTVAGFGRFMVRKAAAGEAGEKPRRVIFKRATRGAKGRKAGKAGKAGKAKAGKDAAKG